MKYDVMFKDALLKAITVEAASEKEAGKVARKKVLRFPEEDDVSLIGILRRKAMLSKGYIHCNFRNV